MKVGFVRRFSAVVVLPLIALAIATRASATTVATFVAVRSGDPLTLSNPQASTVSGRIRLIPDAGTTAPSPVRFSLPAQGTQAFPNVLLRFGSVSSPAILAVESSDTVSVSSAALRVAYPERQITLPVRFNPDAPATGSLVLGILSGLVRVTIFEHATSGTPLVTRTFGSTGEQVTRLRYADLLPAGVAISDGYATVTPLSGQAVALADNPPTRRRAAGRAAPPPPILSVTGGVACEFATGIHASVPPTTGATYRWTLVNAIAQGALTSNALDLALGGHGYASLALDTTLSGSTTTVEATIRIEGRPVYTSSSASSVTLGQDASIDWMLAGSTPTSQTLSSTDFSTVNLDTSATSYTYRPTTAGTKSYTLNAANPCGSGAASGTYVVNATCSSTPSAPTISAGGPTTFCNGGSVVLTASAGYSSYLWSNGATTQAVTVSTSGAVTVQGTSASGCQSLASSPTTVTVNPLPVINSFGATPNAIVFGGTSTSLAFNVANGSSWSLTSSLGNSISPSSGTGNGALSATFGADNEAGPDKITLTVTNACGSVSQTICLYVDMSIMYVSPVCGAGATGNVARTDSIAGESYAWTISDGTITSGAGTPSITFTAGSGPTVQLGLTVTSPNGCAPVSDTKVVTINPALPVPTITASGPTTFCRPGSVTLTSSPASTYYWPATNARTQSIVVDQSGSYAVTVTNAAGCAATSTPVVVTGNLPPQTLITAPAGLCPNSTGNTASVADAGSGGSYLWSVTNGTLTSGQSTRSITFTAGGSGSTSLDLTVTTGAGCAASAQKTVGINGALANASIAGSNNACPNSTGDFAALYSSPGPGNTITWTLTNGTITSGQGTSSIYYTAGASGTVQVAVAITNACGNTSNGSKSVNINGVADVNVAASTCASSTENYADTLDGSFGATYLWTITNGTITSNRQGPGSIYYTAGASGTVQLGLQITSASGCTSTGAKSVTITPSPKVTTFTTGTNPVPPGGGATLSFAYTNGTSWTIVSSLGNALTPGAGSSTTGGTANYTRNTATGPDTLTLTVTGSCGPVARRILIIN